MEGGAAAYGFPGAGDGDLDNFVCQETAELAGHINLVACESLARPGAFHNCSLCLEIEVWQPCGLAEVLSNIAKLVVLPKKGFF